MYSMIIMFNTNINTYNSVFQYHKTYLMKLLEDGPKCGPKYVAFIK
jgi:hypothetical protein